MRLLVTGCGRSGTTWTAAALRTTGLDVGHERAFTPGYNGQPARYDPDGDWTAEVSAAAAPYTPLPDTYVVRLVRNPLRVIASVINRPTLDAANYDDPILEMIHHWVIWNRRVAANETIRLEDITAGDITRLARIADPDARAATPHPAPEPSPPIPWADIAHYTQTERLRQAARLYGYEVPA